MKKLLFYFCLIYLNFDISSQPCSIITNPVTPSASPVCSTTDGFVIVGNSEPTVLYQPYIGNTPVSGTVKGNGGDIQLIIPFQQMVIGANTIKVRTMKAPVISTNGSILQTATPPIINGLLDETEWQLTGNLPTLIDGTAQVNTNAQWGALYDNTYLYLSARIQDNSSIWASNANAWDNDAVEFYLGGYNGMTNRHIILTAANASGMWDVTGTAANYITPPYNFTSQTNVNATTKVWTAEIKIAWTELGYSSLPTTMRFDAAADFAKSAAGRDAQYAWFQTYGFANAWKDMNYAGTNDLIATTCALTFLTNTAIINNNGTAAPTISVSTLASICGSGTVALGATASAGTINWYAASTGGASLGTGISYTTPSIATTTTYYVDATNVCISPRTAILVTVNALPTITLGANPTVCIGTTSANLPYTVPTGSPDKYSIVFNAAALAAGFVNITDIALPATPIVITVPGAAPAATYNATLTVKNNTTGCVSSIYPITVTANAIPTITLGANPAVCSGTTSANLPYTSTTGLPDKYSIVFNAAAITAGFANVTDATLLATAIMITVPGAAPVATYNATLTVKNNASGCTSSSYAITITVNANPTITLGASPTISTSSLTANLPYSAVTNAPDKYSVVYNAAALAAGFVNVTDIALTTTPIVLTTPGAAPAGTYNGTLTVKNASGCNSIGYPFTITINTNPSITLGTNPSICYSPVSSIVTINYSNSLNSPNEYDLDFDATTNSFGFADSLNKKLQASPFKIIIPAGVPVGTYNGKLRVRNTNLSLTSVDYDIKVIINPVPASPTAAVPITVCENNKIQVLTANATVPAGQSIVWYTSAIGGTIQDNLTSITNQKITLWGEAVLGTCNSTSRTPCVLTINPTPVLTITNPAPATCGTTINLNTAVTNNVGNGKLSFWNDPSLTTNISTAIVSMAGTYYVLDTLGVCADTGMIQAKWQLPPSAGTGQTNLVCNSGTFDLFNGFSVNSSDHNGIWTTTDITGALTNTILLDTLKTQNYSFLYKYNDTIGCTGSQTIVTLNVLVQPIAGTNTTIKTCSNDVLNFPIITPNGKCYDEQNKIVNINPSFDAHGLLHGKHVYTYVITPGNTCKSDTSVFTVIADTVKPKIECPSDLTVEASFENEYQASGSELTYISQTDTCNGAICLDCIDSTYLAYVGTSGSVTSKTIQDAWIKGTQNITWYAVDKAGNVGDCSFKITIKEFFIPNLFSPNGDGKNDKWMFNLKHNPNAELTVFNRWGEAVFTSKGYNGFTNPWDGTLNGNPLPIDGYQYIITDNGKIIYSGTVTIIK